MTCENTPAERITAIRAAQKVYFRSGATLGERFRRTMLRRLDQALGQWERRLCDALWEDLHKSPEEAVLTELSIVRGEVRNHLRHLGRWMRPERRPTPLKLQPSTSRILSEPLGTALIIAPWNYPVQLLLNPLVGAISAGCTAVLKPSPYTPYVSATLHAMIAEIYDEEYIAVVEGHREVNTLLLGERWDLIFFTGSPELGRVVMESAARHLTPVVLELGGKSPCIVDRGADIPVAARRIAWGKCLNAGQTCIAPDYLLIREELAEEFIDAFRDAVRRLLGDDPRQSRHYARLVNDRAFDRVASYLGQGTVRVGGESDRAERYIEPTLLTKVDPAAPVMREEIFGPVLPMIPFREQSEIVDFITAREKPLALYYFGPEKQGREILAHTSSGGACLNDTIMHIVSEALPFGGVGNSGMGRYHGRESFDAFSHRRAVLETPTWIDLPFRYMPYRMFRWVRHIL
ncbi:aldehyde dehydrogenase family protein [uncultured Alistipes sp.]|uniref:aldehyde dehydrogenase family protein n=1 Tax=uncultured Alistipes sp. TaxID=538949 RepID=UPI00260A85EB|nr:aldehyde dehydrogenase family protein [uncultured Alistipes sp.]